MSVYPIVLSQNQFLHKDKLSFPFEERGLQFGDGVYEVISIYHGTYHLFDEHIDRLYRSLEAIKIDFPYEKDEFKKSLLELLERNNMKSDGKVYLQVTRGSATRDHVFPENTEPNVYAYISDLARKVELLQNGVATITHPDVRWDYCYIKSLNLLPNVLAKQAAKEAGCYEAILHKDGIVTECSSSNVYLVKGGKIYTFPATKRILHGCVRMLVERLAKKANIPFIEEEFEIEDIPLADEMFLTSSTSEVMPIVQVDGKPIGDGKPGKITRQLQKLYEEDANITSSAVKHTV